MNPFTLNFPEAFVPTMSAAEVVVYAALIYASLRLLLRVIPKRSAGTLAIRDLLFVVVIGEIAGQAMSRDAKSLADFVLVLLTVLLLRYAVDWLPFRSRRRARRVQGRPTRLIRDNRPAPSLRVERWRETDPEDEEAARRRRRRRAEALLAHASDTGS
jgi:hypothetical protein